jgi:hypothetical protein
MEIETPHPEFGMSQSEFGMSRSEFGSWHSERRSLGSEEFATTRQADERKAAIAGGDRSADPAPDRGAMRTTTPATSPT